MDSMTDNLSSQESSSVKESSLGKLIDQYDFTHSDQCYSYTQTLLKGCEIKTDPTELYTRIFDWASSEGDGDSNLKHLAQLVKQSNHGKEILDIILSQESVSKTILTIFSSSYLTQLLFSCIKHFKWLINEGINKIKPKDILLENIYQLMDMDKVDTKVCKSNLQHIHEFKAKETLRIAVNEAMGHYNLVVSEQEYTKLCEVCFQALYEMAVKCIEIRYGQIANGSYTIMALERLATKELTCLSPVELLFIYEGEGNSEGTKVQISAEDYYKAITRYIIHGVQLEKAETLYPIIYPKATDRSDIPIIYTVEDYIRLLENDDVFHDRIHLIKARHLVGDKSLAKDFMESITPVISKKYLSHSEISEVKQIMTRAFRLFEYETVKAIETLTLLFKMFYRYQPADDFCQSLISSIDQLHQGGLISLDEQSVIKKGLKFMKSLEHRAELYGEKSFSVYCVRVDILNRVAQGMAFEGEDKAYQHLLDQYDPILSDLYRVFDKYFHNLFDKSPHSDFLDVLYQEPGIGETFLSQFKFKNINNTLRILNDLSPTTHKGKVHLAIILSDLFAELKCPMDSDRLLVNFVKAVQSYKAKDILLELLTLNRSLIKDLAKLFTTSQYLSDIFVYFPELFEHLIRRDFLRSEQTIESLEKNLEKVLKVKPFSEAIFQFKNYKIFTIGLKAILEINDLSVSNLELSNLAEVILKESYSHFTKELIHEKGKPSTESAIVLLGKLGGRELNIASDLDMFFVYEQEGEIDSAYLHSQFFSDVISRLSEFFSQPNNLGILYEIDLKLRPEGRNSPMIVSASKLKDYLQKKGAYWEKLAYSKARVLSSSPKFKETLENLITHFVYESMDPVQLKSEVITMRKRIANNAMKKSGSQYLFKKGSGGLLDLEFLAEYLTIVHGAHNPSLRKRNIYDMYQVLQQYKIISEKDYHIATISLTFFRIIETNLRIMSNISTEKLPNNKEDQEKLAIQMGFENPYRLLEHYSSVIKDVKYLYNKYLL